MALFGRFSFCHYLTVESAYIYYDSRHVGAVHEKTEVYDEKDDRPVDPAYLHVRPCGMLGFRVRDGCPVQAVPHAEHVDVPEARHGDRQNLASAVLGERERHPVRCAAEPGEHREGPEKEPEGRTLRPVPDADHVQLYNAGPD